MKLLGYLAKGEWVLLCCVAHGPVSVLTVLGTTLSSTSGRKLPNKAHVFFSALSSVLLNPQCYGVGDVCTAAAVQVGLCTKHHIPCLCPLHLPSG